PDDTVFAIRALREDDGTRATWIGTQSGGLTRFANGRLDPPLWPDVTIRSLRIATGDDGAPVMLAACGGGGGRRLPHGPGAIVDGRAALPTDATFDAIETGSGDERALWVATQGAGVARRARGAWTIFDKRSSAILSDSVLSLHVQRRAGRDILWAG